MSRQPDSQSEVRPRRGGRLAEMVQSNPEDHPTGAWPRETWIKLAVLAALFAAVHQWQFRHLVLQWIHDTNWSHGFVIPLFSLYLLYTRRHDLMQVRRKVNLLGLPIMIVAILFEIIGFYPIGTYYICHLNMLLLLGGLVLYLCGWGMVRITWLPIAFLIFAMPIPDLLYARIAVPLQEFAADGATILLRLFGVEISTTASNLQLMSISGEWHRLTVAEACSGIRSLMAFLALGVAWAYLEYRPVWQRVVIVLSAVPIVVLVNVLRVAITCTMYVIDQPEMGQDFMHEVFGLVMLIPAAGLLWLESILLNSLFVEVDEEEDEDDAAESPAVPAEETP